MGYSNEKVESQKKALVEVISGIFDAGEMAPYEVKLDLVPTYIQVIVRLSEKTSITYLRALSKEVMQCFKQYDHIFLKYEFQGHLVYKLSAEGEGQEEIAETWASK